MASITQSHDYLPEVDSAPSPQELAAASSLIAAEQLKIQADNDHALHDSILTTYEPRFSPLITSAHESIAVTGTAHSTNTGVDLTRYEEPSLPDDTDAARESWQAALRQAYVSHSYLSQRQLNLSLLERFGKNAWLIANSQLESELKALEQELARATSLAEQASEERRRNQSRVKGELHGLQDTWRADVGKAIEAELAAEGLRREILDQRRRAA